MRFNGEVKNRQPSRASAKSNTAASRVLQSRGVLWAAGAGGGLVLLLLLNLGGGMRPAALSMFGMVVGLCAAILFRLPRWVFWTLGPASVGAVICLLYLATLT